MKPTLKVTRANFPNTSMFYWMSYFVSVLEQKYNVIIDSNDPDIVFYSQMYCDTSKLDEFTNDRCRSHDEYGPEVKKIFVTGELNTDFQSVVNQGENMHAIGCIPMEHPRYLRLNLHNTTAAWGLYYESKLFDTPYNWMLEPRDGDAILKSKKHFCGVVQNSVVPERIELFEKLSKYKFVRASGSWITNVPPEEATIVYPRIDGEGYRSKVLFLKDCKFSMQIQTGNLVYFTQEKMVHAFASQTIPIFWGNDRILEDGFNPECFVNCHDYKNMDEVVDRIIEIDSNDELYKKMISAPYFIDNKLPEYYNPEHLLTFVEKMLSN